VVAASATSGTVLVEGLAHSKVCPAPRSPHQMQCKMVAFCNLWFAFSDADIESDFVLMASAYSQYLRDSCKQHLALAGS